MTEKLFYADKWQTEFDATVISCEFDEEKNAYALVLDRTAFFPEAGGQYADPGKVDGEAVLDVREADGQIYHYIKTYFAAGLPVRGTVDMQERFARMQQHTAEHIVSGIVHAKYGYENVGFHLGEFFTTMDYDGTLSRKELEEVEMLANMAAASDVPVECFFPAADEYDKYKYRSKKKIERDLRLVRIGNIDLCACCALHVDRTAQVGMIRLLSAEKYKGGTRVTMLSGLRALAAAKEDHGYLKELTDIFKVPAAGLVSAAKEEKQEIFSWRARENAAAREALSKKADALKDGQKNLVIFHGSAEKSDMQAAIELADKSKGKLPGICAVFLGNDEDGYKYILASVHADVQAVTKKMNLALSGRGGGRGQMTQGSLLAAAKDIENFFGEINV